MKNINPNWKQDYKNKLEFLKELRSKSKNVVAARPSRSDAIPNRSAAIPNRSAVRVLKRNNETFYNTFYNDEVESRNHLTMEDLKWLI